MKITVKLFATLRDNRDKIRVLDVNENVTAYEIAAKLDIDPESIAIIMINGRGAEMDATLEANDVLSFFPPVGGG